MKRTFVVTLSITTDFDPNDYLGSVEIGRTIKAIMDTHRDLSKCPEITHEVVSVSEIEGGIKHTVLDSF